MDTNMLTTLIDAVVYIIGASGYAGIFLLMLAESCGVPAPSEAIMPFAGFLVSAGKFNFWLVVLVGAAANLAGSLLAYYIGARGGRPLLEKYGQYISISSRDLDLADRWFVKYGDWTVFFGRLLPIIRTYISFPAGIAQMDIKKFSLFTFAGALPWCALFAWLGMQLGNNWQMIRVKLESFDLAVGVVILFVVGLYVWRHLKHQHLK